MLPPQLLVTVPQFLPEHAATLSGVQPHTPGAPPPPQVLGVEQLPHDTI